MRPEFKRKHTNCVMPGTYAHVVPMPCSRRVEHIDECVAGIVAALNAGSVPTECCCCGHGRLPGTIVLTDGRTLLVFDSRDAATVAICRTQPGEEGTS